MAKGARRWTKPALAIRHEPRRPGQPERQDKIIAGNPRCQCRLHNIRVNDMLGHGRGTANGKRVHDFSQGLRIRMHIRRRQLRGHPRLTGYFPGR